MFVSNTICHLLAVTATIAAVNAHGYTTISRNFLCVDGRNFQCGNIIYEPQSLEAPKGFPGTGPVDGEIASAGLGRFSQLNEQTGDRWLKTNVQSGAGLDFTWKFTVNHKTTGFEYFVTKDNWNPDTPLTRAQFDLNPFCAIPFGGAQPNFDGETHTCTLPSREGYHVILAVWIIGDTGAAFYNMNDVRFGGTNPPVAVVPTEAPVVAPTQAPVISPTAGPPPGGLCSSGQHLEPVNDCTGFVHCVDGAVLPNSQINCPTGLLFSSTLLICDFASSVDCN